MNKCWLRAEIFHFFGRDIRDFSFAGGLQVGRNLGEC
jgi:hypothetical protein